MANENIDLSHTHSVIFKAADGEHTASMSLGKATDERAEFWAKKNFERPGLTVVSVKRTTPQEHAKIIKDNLDANASRVPLDEKTNGQMNRIIDDPELAKDE